MNLKAIHPLPTMFHHSLDVTHPLDLDRKTLQIFEGGGGVSISKRKRSLSDPRSSLPGIYKEKTRILRKGTQRNRSINTQ